MATLLFTMQGRQTEEYHPKSGWVRNIERLTFDLHFSPGYFNDGTKSMWPGKTVLHHQNPKNVEVNAT
jgi:hypothetical protein